MRKVLLENMLANRREQIERLQVKLCGNDHDFVPTYTTVHLNSRVTHITTYQCSRCEKKMSKDGKYNE